MKIKTIAIIVVAAIALLAATHFALNTDWVALIKSLHAPPKH